MLKDSAGPVALGVVAVLLLVVAWVVLAWQGRSAGSDEAAGGRRRLRRRRPSRDHFRDGSDGSADRETPTKRAAIIVNPTKFNDPSVPRDRIGRACREAGWGEPLWLETTVDDHGTGQARAALAEDVDLVCALGGDGTVRAVAIGLLDSHTPMGILPAGTGNLLARNLSLPHDLREAALVALGGRNKRIDVGRIQIVPAEEHQAPEEHIFMVMAGIGFDAVVVSDAPEKLKARVGWLAYGVSGLKNLPGSSFRARASFGGEEPISRRVQSVLVGNCGKLTGGLVLMPDAEVDDGELDSVVLSPQGVVGWVAVAGRVVTRRRAGHERVEHHRSVDVRVQTDRMVEVQLDGDPVGQAREIIAWADPLALTVRVPS
ncbi:diacylglycerol/lipid kinase family protein [Segeticoccus rhizosphaerae]|uniref:diacylglycerol/lipid kinase family protein n=1 Tax=Segeticoccus rhizosphaerae TaxID=1104777 RepID=UPI001264D41D|nr:diacylglycerol kinase family protein [Segeticoccus rhizosphaerae]